MFNGYTPPTKLVSTAHGIAIRKEVILGWKAVADNIDKIAESIKDRINCVEDVRGFVEMFRTLYAMANMKGPSNAEIGIDPNYYIGERLVILRQDVRTYVQHIKQNHRKMYILDLTKFKSSAAKILSSIADSKNIKSETVQKFLKVK